MADKLKNEAGNLISGLLKGLKEMPGRNAFKNFDYQVAQAQLSVEMKTTSDYRAELALSLTTTKKKITTVWLHFPDCEALDAKQHPAHRCELKKAGEYLGLALAAPLTPQNPTVVTLRYKFSPGPRGEMPFPVTPTIRFPLEVEGKCGQGYEMIFPGTKLGEQMDRGLRVYQWQAGRVFKLFLLALHDPQRYLVEAGDNKFYYYFSQFSAPNAKAVAETLAEIYTAQVKMNGPLPSKDYYIVEVNPKLCSAPVGLGGLIMVPNGIFKVFDKARATGIIENELLREWKGRKGEQLKEVR